MSTMGIPAGTIVVGVDGSDSSDRALQWAIEQARVQNRDITLVNSFSLAQSVWLAQAGVDFGGVVAALREDAHRIIKLAREDVETSVPDVEVREVVVAHDIRQTLVELSREAAMIVLGSRGRGPVRSLLLGSVGAAVIRHAHCPVVIHRPLQEGIGRRHGVLVGIDGTEFSQPALEFAFQQASWLGQPLTVLHCYWPNPLLSDAEQQRVVAETIAGMQERYPDVAVSAEVEKGSPESRLVVLGDRMELVVVGAHAGGLASQILLGSVAASVVENARTTVAVVPARR